MRRLVEARALRDPADGIVLLAVQIRRPALRTWLDVLDVHEIAIVPRKATRLRAPCVQQPRVQYYSRAWWQIVDDGASRQVQSSEQLPDPPNRVHRSLAARKDKQVTYGAVEPRKVVEDMDGELLAVVYIRHAVEIVVPPRPDVARPVPTDVHVVHSAVFTAIAVAAHQLLDPLDHRRVRTQGAEGVVLDDIPAAPCSTSRTFQVCMKK